MSTDSAVQTPAETEMPPARPPKEIAMGVLGHLPANIGWERLLYELDFRFGIEEGLDDIRAGRVVSDEEFMLEFGLTDADSC
jgi:hypothetical protein